MPVAAYPDTSGARDAFILARRPPRQRHDPWRAHGVNVEQEPDDAGVLADVVTVFLTGRECPWRCAMCDLWQYTIEEDTPAGAIPHQIREALGEPVAAGLQPRVRHLKLYNAGSFFDPRAVPPSDYRAIAAATSNFPRVLVESHPSLVGPRLDEFLEAVAAESAGTPAPRLEVAMGLETAHPGALERLNKRITVDTFRGAADRLRQRGVALRAFLLVSPPFVPVREQREWLDRSVDVAFDSGATAISLIPVRTGNGTIEALAAERSFVAPTLDDVEDAMDASLARARGRVFADLWDLERLGSCDVCFHARRARLASMNLTQRRVPRVQCPACSPVGARA